MVARVRTHKSRAPTRADILDALLKEDLTTGAYYFGERGETFLYNGKRRLDHLLPSFETVIDPIDMSNFDKASVC